MRIDGNCMQMPAAHNDDDVPLIKIWMLALM